MSAGSVPRLRIGVTGHRAVTLSPVMFSRLRLSVRAAFVDLKRIVDEVHGRAQRNHESQWLRIVSALAEGSDRMVAVEALAQGAELVAVLPFRRDQYLLDFPQQQSKLNFMALLKSAAEVVELDGQTEPMECRNAAYAAVGEAVVARSDVMIAVWNGRPAAGRGGTAEIVAHARHAGRPVLWFSTDGEAGCGLLAPSLLLAGQTISSQAIDALAAHFCGAPR